MTIDNTNFDWVAAREECSLLKAFATLKAQVKNDVEARNKTIYGQFEFRFDITDNGDGFTVHTASERQIGIKTVTFERSGQSLVVIGNDGKEKFTAVLSVSADRKCRFKIGEEEYDFWYVRKMALEDLFFWNS
jgi:hypothetical protein